MRLVLPALVVSKFKAKSKNWLNMSGRPLESSTGRLIKLIGYARRLRSKIVPVRYTSPLRTLIDKFIPSPSDSASSLPHEPSLVKLYVSRDGDTFIDRMTVLRDRLHMRLNQRCRLKRASLQKKKGEDMRMRKRELLEVAVARFSIEVGLYQDSIDSMVRCKPRGSADVLKAISEGKVSAVAIARSRAFDPRYRNSNLTVTSEGLRAALSTIVPSLNRLLSKEDARIFCGLCGSDGVLMVDLLLLGETLEIESETFKGRIDRLDCWGRVNTVDFMRLRSAGFEERITQDKVPEKLAYEYCKSMVYTPEDFSVQQIHRSFRQTKATLDRVGAGGFRGDFIFPNILSFEGLTVYALAALVMVDGDGWYEGHDDDVTCIAAERGGAVRRVASGQMGGGEVGPCVLVWAVGSKKTICRCGEGILERQVQGVAFGGEKDKGGGGSSYVIAVGGDNSQTIGVFDLKAAIAMQRDTDDLVDAPCLATVGMDKLPGALPTVYGLLWHSGDTFITLGQGKSLKWWSLGLGGGDSGNPMHITQKKKGVGFKSIKDVTSVCFTSDRRFLVTGCDPAALLIWEADGSSSSAVARVDLDATIGGVWSVAALADADVTTASHAIVCGCGDSGVRTVRFRIGSEDSVSAPQSTRLVAEGETMPNSDVDKLQQRLVTSSSAAAIPKATIVSIDEQMLDLHIEDAQKSPQFDTNTPFNVEEPSWSKVRHVSVDSNDNSVTAGTVSGVIYKNGVSMIGGHASSVAAVARNPKKAEEFVTVGHDGLICHWIVGSNKPLQRVRIGDPAVGVSWSPDGNMIGVGCKDGAVRLFGFGSSQHRRVSPATSLSSGHSRSSTPTGKSHGNGSHSTNRVASPVAMTDNPQTKAKGNSKKPKITALIRHKTMISDVDKVVFSPVSDLLAAGSHDNFIDLFSLTTRNFPAVRRLRGHTSYITSISWSVDGQCLMSTCGAGELLYWQKTGERITSREQARKVMVDGGRRHLDLSDADHWEWRSILGFPVMGIWPDFSDGTDVNCLDVTSDRKTVVTADDFGGVKLFNFPCLVEDAPNRCYGGHSSHVSSVEFLKGDQHVVSTGGNDRAVFMWKFDSGVQDKPSGADSESDCDSEEENLPPEQVKLVEEVRKIEKKAEERELRRSLKDPFAFLRQGLDPEKVKAKRAVAGLNVSDELKQEMEALNFFIGEFFSASGISKNEIVRKSTAFEEPTRAPKKATSNSAMITPKEKFGVEMCTGLGITVSDDELKTAGIWEIEEVHRKRGRKKMQEKLRKSKRK